MIKHTLENDDGVYIGTIVPVKDMTLAAEVVSAPIDDDGRSRWVWVELANGDLLLGMFPTGSIYEKVRAKGENA